MSDEATLYTYLDIVHGREVTVELAPGEEIECPNCGGTGDDPDTMICQSHRIPTTTGAMDTDNSAKGRGR